MIIEIDTTVNLFWIMCGLCVLISFQQRLKHTEIAPPKNIHLVRALRFIKQADNTLGKQLGSYATAYDEPIIYAVTLACKVIFTGIGFAVTYLLLMIVYSLGDNNLTFFAQLSFAVTSYVLATWLYPTKRGLLLAFPLLLEMAILLPISFVIIALQLNPQWILAIYWNGGHYATVIGVLIALALLGIISKSIMNGLGELMRVKETT